MSNLKELERLQWEHDCSKTSMRPDYVPKTKFEQKTTNGITKCVIAHLKLHGCQAERVSTTGRWIEGKTISRGFYNSVTTKGKFIPGSGKRGSADVHSTVPMNINGQKIGVSVKWEIKNKNTKDRMSDDQKEYAKEVDGAGGLYFTVLDYDDFVTRFNSLNLWPQ